MWLCFPSSVPAVTVGFCPWAQWGSYLEAAVEKKHIGRVWIIISFKAGVTQGQDLLMRGIIQRRKSFERYGWRLLVYRSWEANLMVCVCFSSADEVSPRLFNQGDITWEVLWECLSCTRERAWLFWRNKISGNQLSVVLCIYDYGLHVRSTCH